jgi:hypothetical protein
MKPSAVVVKAGSQASVVINLAVLSTINSQAIQELLECLRIYLSAGGNEIAAAIAHAHVRASMNNPRIRVNRRLSITTKLPFTEDAHMNPRLLIKFYIPLDRPTVAHRRVATRCCQSRTTALGLLKKGSPRTATRKARVSPCTRNLRLRALRRPSFPKGPTQLHQL